MTYVQWKTWSEKYWTWIYEYRDWWNKIPVLLNLISYVDGYYVHCWVLCL